MWKEAEVTYFKALHKHQPEEAQKPSG